MNIIHNDVIRKIVLAFGNLFSQIPLVKYDESGNEVERYIISLIYAAKEQYVHRLNDDPELNSRVQVVIPTLSYEMMGMNYDSSRKQITNIKNFASMPEGIVSQYNPVPYDFDFDLNLYARTFEDAHQVVEHIVSYFTPDYTLKVNLVPAMGITKELPVLLKSVDRDVTYEGDREDNTRRIIFSFHFTVKGFIFGKITDVTNKLIKHSITSIYNEISPHDVFDFNLTANTGYGTYKSNELAYQGISLRNHTAVGKVIKHDTTNDILELTDIRGDFVTTLPIIGASTHANYYYTSSSPSPGKMAQVDVRVDPYSANVTSNWTANTIITEYQ